MISRPIAKPFSPALSEETVLERLLLCPIAVHPRDILPVYLRGSSGLDRGEKRQQRDTGPSHDTESVHCMNGVRMLGAASELTGATDDAARARKGTLFTRPRCTCVPDWGGDGSLCCPQYIHVCWRDPQLDPLGIEFRRCPPFSFPLVLDVLQSSYHRRTA
jgi:hypothetical protein